MINVGDYGSPGELASLISVYLFVMCKKGLKMTSKKSYFNFFFEKHRCVF